MLINTDVFFSFNVKFFNINHMDNVEQVLDAMRKAGKPLKAGEVAELAGLDKKVVEKAMDQLKKTEMIVSPKRCYWEPK